MKADFVVIGKVGATYGVQGWIKVLSYTEWTNNILSYTPWYLEDKEHLQPVTVTDSREHGKSIVIKLAGYDTPEQSRCLTGKNIVIMRSQLPSLAKDEYYWSDLKGLTVINQDDVILGKVIYIIATGSNDVLVVKGEKEHAIPYLPNEVIKKVDLQQGVIYVDWESL
jgi:16S rRNA processing protein RimM